MNNLCEILFILFQVLLPECLLAIYMEVFKLGKEEAEKRIKATPVDDEW